MVVLQKLEKALVHSGDVTNMCWWERGDCIQVMVFFRVSCGSSGKALGYGLDGPGSIPGVEAVEILFTPSYPDCSWGPLKPTIK